MTKKYKLITNILNADWTGSWSGVEFKLSDGETKLLPTFMADKFAEIMAKKIFHSLNRDLVGREELKELEDKMLGEEESLNIEEKTDLELLVEEIDFVNTKYLKH